MGWLSAHLLAEPLPGDGSRLFQLGHYTVRNGLASSFVYATAQDRQGYIWIATHDGLSRFDGYQFKTWPVRPGAERGFTGSIVTGIHIDARDRFWLVIRDSLWLFNPRDGACRKLDLPHALVNFKGFYPLDSQTVLVDAGQDLVLYPERGEALAWGTDSLSAGIPDRKYKTEFSLNRAGECFAAQLHPGYLQVWRYLPGKRMFLEPQRISLPVTGQLLNAFLVDRQGWVTLSVQGFVPARFPLGQSSAVQLQPGAADVVHLEEDRQGRVWLSQQTGLSFWDNRKNELWQIRALDVPGALRSDVVRQVREDRAGLLWIATGNGVQTLNPQQQQVHHLAAEGPAEQRVLGNFILGLQTDAQGSLRIQYFETDAYSVYRPGLPIRHYSLPKNAGPGNSPPGITVVRPIPSAALGIPVEAGRWWMFRGNVLWLAGTDSAWSTPSEIMGARLAGDSIWLATATSGLQCFRLSDHQFITEINTRYQGMPQELNCLYATGDTLWVGTRGEGLIAIDLRSGSIRRFTPTEGLAHANVYTMTRDQRGRLWIGTAAGLSCFQPATGRFRNFGPDDGFRNDEYNRHSSCLLPDGRLAFGGMRGIDLFHPDSLVPRTIPWSPVLTDIQVFNQSWPLQDTLRLTHDQHSLRFFFSLLHFAQANGQSYQYRLEGVDPDWTTIKGKNDVSYSHLSPGRYVFWLRAWNDEGSWSDPTPMVTLFIAPAWYQTGLFYFLVVLAAGGLIYGLFVFRLKQKLRIYQVRQHIHRDLHDDVGATLSAVKAYAEILREKPGNTQIPEMIRENATEMIDRLEEIAWATDPSHDTLSSLKHRLLKFASPLCHARGIELVLDMDGASDPVEISGETRQHVLLIVKEAVNNMIKYAGATECRMSLRQKGGWLYLRIKDNGKGSSGEVQGGGNGWRSMEQRAEAAGGHMEIRSALGQGTEIRLAVPLQYHLPNSWGRGKP